MAASKHKPGRQFARSQAYSVQHKAYRAQKHVVKQCGIHAEQCVHCLFERVLAVIPQNVPGGICTELRRAAIAAACGTLAQKNSKAHTAHVQHMQVSAYFWDILGRATRCLSVGYGHTLSTASKNLLGSATSLATNP